jgi:hypothetical protein
MPLAGGYEHLARLRIALFLWCIAIAFLWPADETQAEVDFYTVIEAFKEYEEIIKTHCFSGKYRESFDTVDNADNNYRQENTSTVVEFRYDLANGRWQFDQRSSFVLSQLSKEPFETRKVESFDGKLAYRLTYTYVKEPIGVGIPPDRPLKLDIGPIAPGPPGNLHPLRVIGLGIEPNHSWPSILHLLETEPCTWEGSDQISGVDCYRIGIRPRANRLQHTVWFDPAQAFLPMRQESRVRGNDGKAYENISFWIETKEFKEFLLPGGETISFPSRIRTAYESGLNQTFELLDLTFHKELPVSAFRMDPEDLPTGAYVFDYMKESSYYVGGEEGQRLHEEWERLSSVVEETVRQKLGEHPHARPAPVPVGPKRTRTSMQSEANRKSNAVWLMTNLCLLALLASGWIFYRIQRSKRRNSGGAQ